MNDCGKIQIPPNGWCFFQRNVIVFLEVHGVVRFVLVKD